MNDFIPVNEPLLNGNEKKYLNECIDTGWISSEGPFVTKFEESLAQYVDRRYGIAVCNGTVALDLAVEALQLKPGDEVIMPTFTIISCIAPLIRRGIKPVLVDSCLDTWNMDVTQIEEKVTPKTKAIMVVHIYGLPVDMQPVLNIAKKYDLKIIEDAAEMHGQTYNGKKCGSFGDVSIFSFYPNKHITTGEGGMVLTDNEELANRCYSFRNLCLTPERRFVHDELGYNYRLSNIQAALGLAQLEKLEEHITTKKLIGIKYTEQLKNVAKLQLPVVKTAYADNIYWVYGLVIKESENTAMETMRVLAKNGIGTRPFFFSMHKQPVFMKMGLFEGERYPIAEYLSENGFYIPSGMTLTETQIKQVSDTVRDVMNEIN